MATRVDDLYAKNYKEIENGVNEQYAQRKKTTQSSINSYNDTINNQVAATNEGYQLQMTSGAAKFDSLIDRNYIDELVAKKNLEESMANSGLTDSGLNRSQQTALTVQRGNADASVRQQQTDFENNLRAAMAQVQAEAEANKANYANQMNTADAQWYQDMLASGRQTALTAAQQQYASEQEYASNMVKQGYTQDSKGNWVKTAITGDDLNLYKAINGQMNINIENGMDDDVAAASARIAYGVGTNTDYAIVQGSKAGYAGSALTAYVNAGGGQNGIAAAEQVVVGNANKIVSVIKDPGGISHGGADADGKWVANRIKEQIGKLNMSGYSEAEIETARALSVGKIVASHWAKESDAEKEKRIVYALKELGIYDTNTLSYAKQYAPIGSTTTSSATTKTTTTTKKTSTGTTGVPKMWSVEDSIAGLKSGTSNLK